LGKISFAHDDLLDYGCGPGRLFEAYVRKDLPNSLTAIDRELHMLSRAREVVAGNDRLREMNVQFHQGDLVDLRQFPDKRFTTAVCWTVLNHVIDDDECEAILNEICRLSNNRIILCEPLCRVNEPPTVFAAFPSKRRYESYYTNILEKNGFGVEFSKQRFGSLTHPESERGVFIALRCS
jgi:ubiquinone/menaquinone biosynthesis C-methylase UbiE